MRSMSVTKMPIWLNSHFGSSGMSLSTRSFAFCAGEPDHERDYRSITGQSIPCTKAKQALSRATAAPRRFLNQRNDPDLCTTVPVASPLNLEQHSVDYVEWCYSQ